MASYFDALAPGGILAFIGGQPGAIFRALTWGKMLEARLAKKQGKTMTLVAQKTTVQDLEGLMRLAVQGQAKPVIDTVFSLEEAVKAFECFGEGRFIGKLVIKLEIKPASH
jgi:NADPH:quinone reductase-like Zn-dependent oxidoreductase